MENYVVEGSKTTPSILLDFTGYLKFSGRSIHEDPDKFFNPIVDWIKDYCANPPVSETTVDVELEYFNSGAAKFLLSILQILVKNLGEDHKLIINWCYESGDDDIMERGEYYSSLLDKKFVFTEID